MAGKFCRVCHENHWDVSDDQERLMTELGLSPFQVQTLKSEMQALMNELPVPPQYPFSDGMASRLHAQGLTDEQIAVIQADLSDVDDHGLAQVGPQTVSDIRERDKQRKARARAANPEQTREKAREQKRKYREKMANT